jgi:hypothetical protein
VVEDEVVGVPVVEGDSLTFALAFEGAGVESFAAGSVVPSAGGRVLSGGGA